MKLRLTAAGLAAALVAFVAPAWGQWAPNETRATAQADLIDFEFSQSRAMFVWSDSGGYLWVGYVDRNTGRFSPPDGKGLLVDNDAMTFDDAQKTKNGPEWVTTSWGDSIVYTKYAGRHSDNNSRLGYAYPLVPGSSSCSYISSDGYWCATTLSTQIRKAPYGSQVAADPAPRITYVDNKENHFWREVTNPATEKAIPEFPASNYPIRQTVCGAPGVPGARSAIYPITVNGVDQAFYRDFDTNQQTQLTFDAGNKYELWMWCAPEFGNELVFMTLINDVELRIYRNLPTGTGTARAWTPIFSKTAPTNQTIASPEPFTFNGKSYVFMAQTVKPNVFRSEIWVSNIDAANPIFKRITPTTPLVSRTDPEVFVTATGPYIYYNMLNPGTRSTGNPKPCRDPSCSLGVWFSDPGIR